MKRRKFIKSGSLLTLPILLQGTEIAAIGNSVLANVIGGDTDKVLVLIQLEGGNDGLNTLIPLDQYSNLQAVRSNVIIPESSTLKITDTNAFHPSMQGVKELWDDAKIGIIQNVGYPNQNRSHFRSTDIWNTASNADEFVSTGWLGRYFDQNFPGYPDNYPNTDCPDPFAITLGFFVSETCQGPVSNYSIAINNPDDLGQVDVSEGGEVDMSCYGNELTFIRETIRQTNAYSSTVSSAYDKGNNLEEYPEDIGLAAQLKIVARLISGGLQTKVYVVSLGGFDLHGNQVEDGDTTSGEHAELLSSLSQSVNAFQNDLVALGVDERVIGLTYSEFGRRIRSNFSFGTDHGTAAPMFVFGSCVQAGILGDNPEIGNEVDVQEGVPMQYDFRSVYGTILLDWFGANEADVKELLYDDFQHIPFLKLCDSVSATDDDKLTDIKIELFPNPCTNHSYLNFDTVGGHARISVFDVLGSELVVISNRKFAAGSHRIYIEMHKFLSGSYFVRVQLNTSIKTVKLIKH